MSRFKYAEKLSQPDFKLNSSTGFFTRVGSRNNVRKVSQYTLQKKEIQLSQLKQRYNLNFDQCRLLLQ